ncbi:MAG: hypothetical protein MO852_17435, partial [Candidatus Devosia euplotis]|nr:hypothetical protein [Candidatus Devosia euplotis]
MSWRRGLAAVGLVGALGCTNDTEDSGDAPGGPGDVPGDRTEDDAGTPTGTGPCGKGRYGGDESAGSLIVCDDPDDPECLPLSDFEGYTSIPGIFTVVGQSSLEPLKCLEVASDFRIGRSPNLTSLAGLENLRSAFSVGVVFTPELKDLQGLDSLEELTELNVANTGVESFSGLPEGL